MPNLISQKCYYAIKALFDLARQGTDGPVKIGAIADRQHIPIRFLEAILRQLKQAGFVDSRRGADGGYLLAKNASQIRLIEIISFFEGDFAQFGAAANPEQTARGDVDFVLSVVRKESLGALTGVLERWTVEDLVKKAAADSDYLANFSI